MHRMALLHVAKTAGTAVQSFLRSCFAPNSVIIRAEADRASGFASIAREMDSARFVSGHICYQEARDLCGDADWRFGITLRDPIARTLSNLRYYLRLPRHSLSGEFLAVRQRLEAEPFDAYLRSLSSPLELHNFVNLQTRFLLDFEEPSRPLHRSDLDLAKRRLAAMDHLFLTEQLEESLQQFCWQTGIPDRAHLPPTNTDASERQLAKLTRTALSAELHEALASVNSLDLELWSFAQELLRARHSARADSGADAARAKASPSEAAVSTHYAINLADGPRCTWHWTGFDYGAWHWTGFDYGAWSTSGAGEPRAFPAGRLLDTSEQAVAWVVQSPAVLWVTVPAGGPWQASIEIVAWVCFRSLADLRIRVDGHSVVHTFSREEDGKPSVTFLLPTGAPGRRAITIETAPLLYLNEFSEFPGFGQWLGLPRVSVAIRSLRVSAAPADPPTQSAAERMHLLAAIGGAILCAFDLRPDEIAWLLPTVTAAAYADPATRWPAVSYRDDAGRQRLGFKSPPNRESLASSVPPIAVALEERTGQVISGCLLRDVTAGAACVVNFLPGETIPDHVSIVIVDPTTGRCMPSVADLPDRGH